METKLDLFHTDLLSGRLLHLKTLKTARNSKVTENNYMKKFITQLMENFSARFDDLAISRDVIGFVRDPFTVSPGGEFSSNVRKMMPLDEAAIQNELIDIQLSGDMNAAHRGAGSLSNFWGDLSQRV